MLSVRTRICCPNPDAYAEIIRLNPPDFHPSVESFDLADALADPCRRPFFIPWTRFGFLAGSILKIRRRFPCWAMFACQELTGLRGRFVLSDAVHLAGGLAPDAQTADAQVFRYLPDGKFKIFSVNLSEALAEIGRKHSFGNPRPLVDSSES